ncbi:MAG: tetratricopeptide repeat protein [Phycisphaerales bacterium]
MRHDSYTARPRDRRPLALLACLAGTTLAVALPTAALARPVENQANTKQPTRSDQPRNDQAARTLNTANGLLQRGLFDLAATEYRAFLQAAPDHGSAPIARYGLGVCLHRLAQHAEALEQLEPLVAINNFQFAREVDLLIGTCRLTLGDYAESAEALRRMIRAAPRHPAATDASAMLVEALSRAGEHEQTAREARSFAQSWPDSPLRERTDLFLALAEMSQGNDAQAQRVLEASLERFPTGSLAEQGTLLLAQCRHRRGLLGEAADAYAAVVDAVRGPLAADALLGLGQIALADNRLDDAAAALDRMLREYPDSPSVPTASLARARVSLEQNDTRAARIRLDSLEQRGPGDLRDDAAYWLAKCDLRDGRPADAAARLARAAEAFEDSPLRAEMAFDLAIAHVRAGDDEAADAELGAFREAYPEHTLASDAMATHAGVLHRLGEYDDSRELCERYLRDAADARAGSGAGTASGREREIEFLLAENRYLSGDLARAERAYAQFIERHEREESGAAQASRLAAARFRLAMCVYRQDRLAEAEPLLEPVATAARQRPEFAPAILALGDVKFQRGVWDQAEAILASYLDLADVPSRDDALMKLGLARARQNKHAEALDAFNTLRRQHPDSVHALQARFESGQCLLALDQNAEARREMEGVLEAGRDSRFAPHALMALGTIARREGRNDDAATLLAEAARLGGGELAVEAELQRGEALLGTGDHAAAAEVFAAFVRANPDSAQRSGAQARLAIALARAGEHQRAIDALNTLGRDAASLDAPTRHAMLYEVSWCHQALDEPREAVRLLEALVADSPRQPLLAHSLLALGGLKADEAASERAGSESSEAGESTQEAAALFERAIAAAEAAATDQGNTGDNARNAAAMATVIEQASYRLGACRLELGDFAGAADALEPFAATFRDSDLRASALVLRGEALLNANRVQQAADAFQAVVDEHPASDQVGPALLRLGESLAVLQLWSRSEAAFAAWLEREPADDAEVALWFQARFGQGWARENQGRYEEAMRDYARVVEQHEGPTAARAQFQIGQCLFAMGRHEDAARELIRVDILYAYPEWSAAALYEAGRCFMAMGRTAEAREQFEAVRQRFADTSWANLAAQRLAGASPARTPGRSEN